jgi:hypothetical protein
VMCSSQVASMHKSQFCPSLPNSAFSDVILSA